MNLETVRTLDAINHTFYNLSAQAFDATRSAPWAGWEQLPPLLTSGNHQKTDATGNRGTLRVLDLGCGNGRFARFLLDRLPRVLHYVGLDASQPLLAHARSILTPPKSQFEWHEWNFLDNAFPSPIESRVFDLVVLFGVIHHVPSFALRRCLLERAAARLAPNGILALAFWRFQEDSRFKRRIIPWEEFNRLGSSEMPEVDPTQLEPGDTLLAWGQQEGELRYCHAVDAGEEQRLLQALSLVPLADYFADGRAGNLNHYRILKRVENTSLETGSHDA